MKSAAIISAIALGLRFLSAPLAADAQQPTKAPQIGMLRIQSRSEDPFLGLFRQALREIGYVDGQNIASEIRWAEGERERFPALAAELVRLNVDAIVAFGDPAIRAAQQATPTIPIVGVTDDLVGAGLVASLARPGGNTTGVSILASELNVKRLELLKKTLPKVSRAAALWDSGTGTFHLRALEATARSLGVELKTLGVRSPDDLARAFETAKNWRAGAINVLASPLLNAFNKTIIDLAARGRLPAIYQWRESAEAGGLMSYGPTTAELYRITAAQLDKILKGAKPADLPVEQPTKFELVINLKTARALGLTIPPSVLIRADQVIE